MPHHCSTSHSSPGLPEAYSDVSVIVCARNEQRTVEPVLLALKAQLPGAQLILVDNGSSDATATIASKVPGVLVISAPCAGKGNAMRAGAAVAQGDWLLFHDADGEYCAEDCPAVVDAARKAGWAIGTRLVSYEAIFPSSWAANAVVRAALRWRTGVDVPDVLTGTRCIRRTDFQLLRTLVTGFGIETEISRKMARMVGAPGTAGVRFMPRTRDQGKKIRASDFAGLLRQAMK